MPLSARHDGLLDGGLLGGEQYGDLIGESRAELAPADLLAAKAGQRAGIVVAVQDLDVGGCDECRVATPMAADTRREQRTWWPAP